MEHEQQIDRYLLGQLDEAAARALEQRAETDPDFAAELQLHRDILLGIELAGEETVKAQIAAADRSLANEGFFGAEPPAGPPSTGAFLKKYAWVVLTVALLSALAVLWWRGHSQPATPMEQSEKPAEGQSVASAPTLPSGTLSAGESTHTSVTLPEETTSARRADERWLAMAREAWPLPDYSGIRGGDEPAAQAPLPARAAAFFQKKDYAAVADLLEAVPPTDPNYWMLSEMYAQACFLSGDVQRAARRLRSIAASGQMPFAERAEWCLALCCLADFPQGRAEFEALVRRIAADDGHPYTDAAKRLTERLAGGG